MGEPRRTASDGPRNLSVDSLRATSFHELRAALEGSPRQRPAASPAMTTSEPVTLDPPARPTEPSATAAALDSDGDLAQERLLGLRRQRAIRQDLLHHSYEPHRAARVGEQPSLLRRALTVTGQALFVLAAVVGWTALLGVLLMEDSGSAPMASQPAGDIEATADADADELLADGDALDDAVVLDLQLEREVDGDPGAETPVIGDEGDDAASTARSFGALPPLQVEFDDQCSVEIDPELLDDVGSVWPWHFEECEFAPIDLDGTDGLWIVVVSSMGSPDVPPSSLPASRNGHALGLLWSTHYPSLNPGWWVLYAGPFEAHGDAVSAARTLGGSAYVRYLEVGDEIR